MKWKQAIQKLSAKQMKKILCQLSVPQYIAEKVWTEGNELASQDSNMHFPWLH